MQTIRTKFKEWFIDGLFFPEDISEEDRIKLSNVLNNFCVNQVPSKLFRYRVYSDKSVEAFKNDIFPLTSPKNFNDPYDSMLFIDINKVLNNFDTISNADSFNSRLKLLNDTKYRESQIALFGQDYVNFLIDQLKQNNSKNIISDQEHKDSIEMLKKMYTQITSQAKSQISEIARIACLSETINSTLMWSHYSKNHTGFAIEYNFQEIYNSNQIPSSKTDIFSNFYTFPVIYSDKRFDATILADHYYRLQLNARMAVKLKANNPDYLLYLKCFLQKSSDWAYENEWRMIKLIDNIKIPDTGRPIANNNIKPKSIFLGAQISDDNKQELIEIARSKGISTYQMILDDTNDKYNLDAMLIE